MALWRAAAYTISWPALGQFGLAVQPTSRPRLIDILPPGSAQAFGVESLMTLNSVRQLAVADPPGARRPTSHVTRQVRLDPT